MDFQSLVKISSKINMRNVCFLRMKSPAHQQKANRKAQ